MFETLGIVIVLFTLSQKLAVALLFSAPLLAPVIAALSSRIKTAARSAQVQRWKCRVVWRVPHPFEFWLRVLSHVVGTSCVRTACAQ